MAVIVLSVNVLPFDLGAASVILLLTAIILCYSVIMPDLEVMNRIFQNVDKINIDQLCLTFLLQTLRGGPQMSCNGVQEPFSFP